MSVQGLSEIMRSNRKKVLDAILDIHSMGHVISRTEVSRKACVCESTAYVWIKNLKKDGLLPKDAVFGNERKIFYGIDVHGMMPQAIKNLELIAKTVLRINAESKKIYINEISKITGVPRSSVSGWLKKLRNAGLFTQDVSFKNEEERIDEIDLKSLEKRLEKLRAINRTLGRRITYEELKQAFPDQ